MRKSKRTVIITLCAVLMAGLLSFDAYAAGIDIISVPDTTAQEQDDGTLIGVTAGRSSEPVAFEITTVNDQDTGLPMARCYAPKGYTVEFGARTFDTGIATPVQIILQAKDDAAGILFSYASEREYACDTSYFNGTAFTDEDGTYNLDQMAETLHVMDADEYCSYRTELSLGDDIHAVLVETAEVTWETELLLQSLETDFYQEMLDNGIALDMVDYSIAEKVYALELDNKDYYYYVGALVRGYEFSSGAGDLLGTIRRTWGPMQTYTALIPAKDWDQVFPAFKEFMANTRVSDEFILMLEHISLQMVAVKAQMSSELLDQLIADSARDYLDSSTYDVYDSFSDYIYDQNDYVTSGGEHVKMSTQYDHVYEDEYGNVWGSNSGGMAGWTELEVTQTDQ